MTDMSGPVATSSDPLTAPAYDSLLTRLTSLLTQAAAEAPEPPENALVRELRDLGRGSRRLESEVTAAVADLAARVGGLPTSLADVSREAVQRAVTAAVDEAVQAAGEHFRSRVESVVADLSGAAAERAAAAAVAAAADGAAETTAAVSGAIASAAEATAAAVESTAASTTGAVQAAAGSVLAALDAAVGRLGESLDGRLVAVEVGLGHLDSGLHDVEVGVAASVCDPLAEQAQQLSALAGDLGAIRSETATSSAALAGNLGAARAQLAELQTTGESLARTVAQTSTGLQQLADRMQVAVETQRSEVSRLAAEVAEELAATRGELAGIGLALRQEVRAAQEATARRVDDAALALAAALLRRPPVEAALAEMERPGRTSEPSAGHPGGHQAAADPAAPDLLGADRVG